MQYAKDSDEGRKHRNSAVKRIAFRIFNLRYFSSLEAIQGILK